jgi:hypothetical protein
MISFLGFKTNYDVFVLKIIEKVKLKKFLNTIIIRLFIWLFEKIIYFSLILRNKI